MTVAANTLPMPWAVGRPAKKNEPSKVVAPVKSGSRMLSDDSHWVERALAGAEEGYRELMRRYERPIFSLVVRMVRDRPLAEDLSQEVFIKAFRRLDSFDRSRKFSSWLFKIAHNTAIDELRRRHLPTVPIETPTTEGVDLLNVLPEDAGEGPERAADRLDLTDAIEAAIGSLRPSYREAIVLRFQEGLSYEEVGEIMGLPLGTVKTHLHRARKELALRLGERGWEPGSRRKAKGKARAPRKSA